MVHVPDLLRCVAVGPTHDAIAATPEVIRAYRHVLGRHGAEINPDAPFDTRVAKYITKGEFTGNGSPHILVHPDIEPLGNEEFGVLVRRILG